MSLLEKHNLQPAEVFKYFEEMSAIPHGSRNTKAISDYLVEFAKKYINVIFTDETFFLTFALFTMRVGYCEQSLTIQERKIL